MQVPVAFDWVVHQVRFLRLICFPNGLSLMLMTPIYEDLFQLVFQGAIYPLVQAAANMQQPASVALAQASLLSAQEAYDAAVAAALA